MSAGKEYFALKNRYKIVVVLFALVICSCATRHPASVQRENVNNQIFYDELSPYGEWVDYPNYGYVWLPDVDRNFSPYSTSGYWANTNYGWTWVSDYSWGWAPFHYGRWDYDNYYGWLWVPGREWGPSWVTWRTGNGYYGWTPMRPGISTNQSFGNEYRDLDRWNFVRERDFGRSDIHRYYANRNEYNTIIDNSTVINNTYIDRSRNSTYISGPSRNDVQRVTGRRVNNVTIRDNERPGQVLKNSQLQIYRPQIQKTTDQGRQPVPSKITKLKDVIPSKERNAADQQNRITPEENNRRWQQQSPPQRQVERQREYQQQQQIERRNQEENKQQQQRQVDRQRQQRQAEPTLQQQQKQNAEPTENKRQERQQNAATERDNKRMEQDKEPK